jgi:GNAT superfamily N-acetyltransferase
VHVAPAHLRAPDPGVRRAKEDEVAELERLVERSAGDPDPLAPGDLMAAALRGHLWVIVEGSTLLGMFRVEGASLRHVQIGDLIVPVTQRGKGNGTRLARAAAQIARDEYARDAVVASLESPAASKTLAAAGYLARGALEDVRLH